MQALPRRRPGRCIGLREAQPSVAEGAPSFPESVMGIVERRERERRKKKRRDVKREGRGEKS